VLGKPEDPRNIRPKGSCSSWVFLIFEGLCQLVILSVGFELSFFNLFDCFNKLIVGYSNYFIIAYKLPYLWVIR
jgi:hypothetical protein